jgi:DNA-binding response OmpR family regulator
MIRRERPDAVVLDWVMPEMQGSDVCQAIKEDDDLAAIPVLMLTARASDSDIAGAFEHGADDYLTKPFDLEELDQRLRQLLGR